MELGRARRGLAIGVLIVIAAILAGATALGVAPWSPRGPAAAPAPRFVDATEASGLRYEYEGTLEFSVGGGVAILDCDDNGLPDVYAPQGDRPAQLFRNRTAPGSAIRFESVEAGPDGFHLQDVTGAYPIDIDGDRRVDLVTLRTGENVVLRGLGDCEFARANEAWGIDGGNDNTHAFSATWEAGEAHPTLAFGNYLDHGNDDPDTRCQPSVLLRPVPGASEVRYQPPVRLEPAFCTLSLLFSDWSGSGRADLRVSNDRAFYRQSLGQEQLWKVAPGEAPVLFGAEDGWNRVQVEGMGIASFDLTRDGLPEVYLTSQAASKLQTLDEGAAAGGRPSYADIGLARGVNVAQPFTGSDTNLPSTAWHPEFDDVNNDGLIDLFVSKGNTTDVPDFAMEDPSNLLLGQADGTFREAADVAGIVTMERGRGAALVDLDLDGALDLIEVFYDAPAKLWRNAGLDSGAEVGHWLAVRVRQPGTNPDAIGGRLEVRSGEWSLVRELTIGGGHGGGELGWIHVGLGAVESAEVRVVWPGGETGPWQPVPLDGFVILERNATTAQPWAYGTPVSGG